MWPMPFCPYCAGKETVKNGKKGLKNQIQQFICKKCDKSFSLAIEDGGFEGRPNKKVKRKTNKSFSGRIIIPVKDKIPGFQNGICKECGWIIPKSERFTFQYFCEKCRLSPRRKDLESNDNKDKIRRR